MQFERIVDDQDTRLAAVEAIYVEAIPASERKPVGWLGIAAKRGDFRLTVALLGDAPAGFALTFYPAEDDFVLLEYLAVAIDQRGRGTGGRLFDIVAAECDGRAVLLELETADTSDRARRQAFYRQHDCQRVRGLDYQLPLNTTAPLMQLFVAHARLPLPREQLQRWLIRVYTDVYGMSGDDPRLERMLRAVAQPVCFD